MEICLGVGLRQSRRVSGVDPMRVLDDLRLGGLPEHLDQAEDRRNAAGDDVGKRLSRIDRRQLIAFADKSTGFDRQRRPWPIRLTDDVMASLFPWAER
jgi:hypothetical protein